MIQRYLRGKGPHFKREILYETVTAERNKANCACGRQRCYWRPLFVRARTRLILCGKRGLNKQSSWLTRTKQIRIQLLRWDTTDAEFMVSSRENPQLSKAVSLVRSGQNIALDAVSAAGNLAFWFKFIQLHFCQFSSNKLMWVVNS